MTRCRPSQASQAEPAAQPDAARQLGDRGPPSDRRHRPLVEVAERRGRAPSSCRRIWRATCRPDCIATGRELRQDRAVAVGGGGDVADRPDARASRHAQVRLDDDPAAAALRELERARQRVRLHAGRPDERLAREHLAVGERDRVAGRPTRPGRRAAPRRRAICSVSRAWRWLGALNGCSRWSCISISTTRARPTSRVAVVLPEHHGEQLGERPGRLDAGRSAADDDEGEPAVVDDRPGRRSAASKRRSTWFRSRVASSSVYSGKPCSAAPRIAEVRHGGTGGEHEVVERQTSSWPSTASVRAVPVDAGDASLRNATFGCRWNRPRTTCATSVALSPAVATWYRSGWNVWKLCSVDEGDLDRRSLQAAGDLDPAEPGADHHDLGDHGHGVILPSACEIPHEVRRVGWQVGHQYVLRACSP